jgi:O-antigen/teichoic acid export membrane protein
MARAQRQTLRVLLLLAFPIAMGLTILAPDLIILFTRSNASQYLPISAHMLMILAWFLPFSFVNGLLQYVLIAVDRQHAITRAFVIGALFNTITNLIAVPWFGLYAASVTTILSECVLYLCFLPLLRAERLVPPLAALVWRPALAALAMGLLMGGIIWTAMPFGWLLAALVAPAGYAAALWLMGGIGADDLALARRITGRERET